MKNNNPTLASELNSKIHFIRGYRVMLDSDLAELYGVETRAVNQAARRNPDRFPDFFAFQLFENEWESLRSQNVILKMGRGEHRKFLPFVFTQEGIAMLSCILSSETAIKVNVEIMKAFVRMKNSEFDNNAIWMKIDQLEKKYDANFSGVFEAIRQLMSGELPNQHQKIKPLSE